ncbi:RuvX/YqgF family protein [Blattabacterium cuenoti]|uniref:RuvX/YqgF family protein n=1 Tax=Blattabacterium cuenoti TaxID=1653831 RepID=UPI00163CD39B|nr:RuvX/YqgF family protein [Blattabacterium cuenoti]
MGKILGIDYGIIITGLSITDQNKIFAFGLDAIPTKKLMIYLESIIYKEEIEKLIVGLPKKLNNNLEFFLEKKIQDFLAVFCKKYPKVSIIRIDERFTSKLSFYYMISSGLKKNKRKKKILNKISATIILQSYLRKITLKNKNL